jgi:hypothetical protein
MVNLRLLSLYKKYIFSLFPATLYNFAQMLSAREELKTSFIWKDAGSIFRLNNLDNYSTAVERFFTIYNLNTNCLRSLWLEDRVQRELKRDTGLVLYFLL